ncbi:MAG: hypothetical protein DLM71_02035 [Chloroflexi bacterium]|nr:MAG: hypothetical protein DLM71_02035 [Chloroflexota bacterium]
MKFTKVFGAVAALIAAALIGGTLINMAFAGSAPATSSSGSISGGTGGSAANPAARANAAKYCQVFLDRFATNLGVQSSALLPAAKDAATKAVDAAVAAGDLTTAIGDKIKAAIASASGNACGLLNGRFGFGKHGFGAGARLHADLLGAAATSLKLDRATLRQKLEAGSSLKQIATAQTVDYGVVTKAVIDAATKDLDAAVAAGKITKAQETRRLAQLNAALASGTFGVEKREGMEKPGDN